MKLLEKVFRQGQCIVRFLKRSQFSHVFLLCISICLVLIGSISTSFLLTVLSLGLLCCISFIGNIRALTLLSCDVESKSALGTTNQFSRQRKLDRQKALYEKVLRKCKRQLGTSWNIVDFSGKHHLNFREKDDVFLLQADQEPYSFLLCFLDQVRPVGSYEHDRATLMDFVRDEAEVLQFYLVKSTLMHKSLQTHGVESLWVQPLLRIPGVKGFIFVGRQKHETVIVYSLHEALRQVREIFQ